MPEARGEKTGNEVVMKRGAVIAIRGHPVICKRGVGEEAEEAEASVG